MGALPGCGNIQIRDTRGKGMGLLKKVLEKWAIYVGSIKTANSFHLVAVFMFYHAVRHGTRQNLYRTASDFLIS